jgi:hypothetical protein
MVAPLASPIIARQCGPSARHGIENSLHQHRRMIIWDDPAHFTSGVLKHVSTMLS